MLIAVLRLPIISNLYTATGTEWPYLCWSAVKKLLTLVNRHLDLVQLADIPLLAPASRISSSSGRSPARLSSATLELALICLIAVINCTNSHLSTDVSLATAIDMFCSVGHICYLI